MSRAVDESVSADQLAAATGYEEHFVPALFESWGPVLVEAARLKPGQVVLDVATGTGVLARAASRAVGPHGKVTGLDRNPAMLAVARQKAPGVQWRLGHAEELPFDDASFDAVVSQFGLMFFDDRIGALREMWRVLRPGGRLAVAVWASLEDTPAYAAEVSLLERFAGGAADAAADALRAPFALGDRREFAALFVRAGIPVEDIRTHPAEARFPDIRGMLEPDLRGWLPFVGVQLDESVIDRIMREAETELRMYVIEDGSVRFMTPGHVAVAGRL